MPPPKHRAVLLIPAFAALQTPQSPRASKTQHKMTTPQRANLERIARELTVRRTQVRQRIAVAKRALSLVLDKLDDIEDRLEETACMHMDDDDLDAEWNAVQRLLDLRDEIIVRRQLLLSALIALGRHLIMIRQRERLVAVAALRLGVVRLRRVKQVAPVSS